MAKTVAEIANSLGAEVVGDEAPEERLVWEWWGVRPLRKG